MSIIRIPPKFDLILISTERPQDSQGHEDVNPGINSKLAGKGDLKGIGCKDLKLKDVGQAFSQYIKKPSREQIAYAKDAFIDKWLQTLPGQRAAHKRVLQA